MPWDFPIIIILGECSNGIMDVRLWKHEKENKIAESYEFTAEEDYLSSAVFVILMVLKESCVK